MQATGSSEVQVKAQGGAPASLLVRLLRLREFALIVMIVLIGLVLQAATGRFLTTANLNAIMLGFATSAIIVVGMTSALVSGGFDLSVGSVFALGGVTAAIALRADIPIGLSILIGVGVGMLAGFITGTLITRAGINPFIATQRSLVPQILADLLRCSGLGAPTLVGRPSDFPNSYS